MTRLFGVTREAMTRTSHELRGRVAARRGRHQYRRAAVTTTAPPIAPHIAPHIVSLSGQERAELVAQFGRWLRTTQKNQHRNKSRSLGTGKFTLNTDRPAPGRPTKGNRATLDPLASHDADADWQLQREQTSHALARLLVGGWS